MSKKLFVGNLNWATDDQSLHTAFDAYGEVTGAQVVTDRDTGRSRGFGFVTYTNEADAEQAMKAMNGSDLDGRSIRVDLAIERDRGQRNYR